MVSVDDLEGMARLWGASVPRAELERLAPLLQALYADLDGLRALPIAGVEPAFIPAAVAMVVAGAPGEDITVP